MCVAMGSLSSAVLLFVPSHMADSVFNKELSSTSPDLSAMIAVVKYLIKLKLSFLDAHCS